MRSTLIHHHYHHCKWKHKRAPAAGSQQSGASSARAAQQPTAYSILAFKNKLLGDITKAIQAVSPCVWLSSTNVSSSFIFSPGAKRAFWRRTLTGKQPMTNSDYHVHDLCQQFDTLFLCGLKKPDEGLLEDRRRVHAPQRDRGAGVDCSTSPRRLARAARGSTTHFNDNLMESYLKCFLENKKILFRYYKKDIALIAGPDSGVRFSNSCGRSWKCPV